MHNPSVTEFRDQLDTITDAFLARERASYEPLLAEAQARLDIADATIKHLEKAVNENCVLANQYRKQAEQKGDHFVPGFLAGMFVGAVLAAVFTRLAMG